jgi:hypothetical protein
MYHQWRAPVLGPGTVLRPPVHQFAGPAQAHPGAGSNFALETMSEDGQGWVWDELGQKLVGLRHRTPRATCQTTSLLSYRGNLSSGRKALR